MEMERKNLKTKSVGNGEGSLYYSDTLQRWVFQYYNTFGKRKTLKQRRNETVKSFKQRVTSLKNQLNTGTYIEKKNDTIKSIIEEHIKQKFKDGITDGNSYSRDKDTLLQIEKCCSNFVNKPIQNVCLNDIQEAKENMKKYAKSGIDRMWRLLKKAFAIASSPSSMLIPYNIMNDENLKKPISEIGTKKILPLTKEEREKLAYVLDYQEKQHKYRNIVKLEWITAMRIGEVLARSIDDILKDKTILYIHNTLTRDENGNTILGKYTKTYNKQTGIDEGKRNFPLDNVDIKNIINEELSKRISNIHNLLFWDYEKNTFICDKEVNAWLRRINAKYKICKGTLHNHKLRHDRITQWKEAGMDMEAIQYLAGHVEGSTVTSDVYIDISENYAFEQLKKVN